MPAHWEDDVGSRGVRAATRRTPNGASGETDRARGKNTRPILLVLASLIVWTLLAGADRPIGLLIRPAIAADTLEPIPPNKDDDLRLFYGDGRVVKGPEAMSKMNSDAALVLWLAGNQFFAMEDVIRAFQKAHPGTGAVGLITLPPGIILNAILKGGWRYRDSDYPMQPDVYASVSLGHLQALKAKGTMDRYMTYLRNRLEMVVARGNPKGVKGIDDLTRPDVRVMLPNPVTEGIMKFYIKKVLVKHGIWDRISGGKECKSCQATPNTYFTSVHHREIPDALKAGTADVGIVFSSEVQYALREGVPEEGIALPPQDSLVDEIAYAIGALRNAPHPAAAQRYLEFLATPAAQRTYARFGFIEASKEDLALKPIP